VTLACIQDDLYGQALHYFREIAGGIIGREQRELRTASWSHPLDSSVEGDPGKGVHSDFGGGGPPEKPGLRLFENRLDPSLILQKGNHLCARAHQLSGAHLALTDYAIGGSNDARVIQIGLRQNQGSSFGAQVSA